jgi:hypothetical protein
MSPAPSPPHSVPPPHSQSVGLTAELAVELAAALAAARRPPSAAALTVRRAHSRTRHRTRRRTRRRTHCCAHHCARVLAAPVPLPIAVLPLHTASPHARAPQARLRKLIAKQKEPIKSILEQSLGAEGPCLLTFSMCRHVKKQRGEKKGHTVEQIIPKYVCSLCGNEPYAVEDHMATKRHLLLEKHLDKAIASNLMTGYSSGEAVLAAVSEATESGKSSLTSQGRRANSKQGRVVRPPKRHVLSTEPWRLGLRRPRRFRSGARHFPGWRRLPRSRCSREFRHSSPESPLRPRARWALAALVGCELSRGLPRGAHRRPRVTWAHSLCHPLPLCLCARADRVLGRTVCSGGPRAWADCVLGRTACSGGLSARADIVLGRTL